MSDLWLKHLQNETIFKLLLFLSCNYSEKEKAQIIREIENRHAFAQHPIDGCHARINFGEKPMNEIVYEAAKAQADAINHLAKYLQKTGHIYMIESFEDCSIAKGFYQFSITISEVQKEQLVRFRPEFPEITFGYLWREFLGLIREKIRGRK